MHLDAASFGIFQGALGELLVRVFTLQPLPLVAANSHVYFSSPGEIKTMSVSSDDGGLPCKTPSSVYAAVIFVGRQN